MNQRWRVLALWLLPLAVALFLGWQLLGNGARLAPTASNSSPPNAAIARMSYGRFLDYVEAGRVTAVDIFDGGRTAVVEAVDPDLDNRVQRLRVDLPGVAPELVNKLKEQGISFDIHPPRTTPPAVGLLGNLLFPLLLIGSLIFLARRSSGMPGGPGQAMMTVGLYGLRTAFGFGDLRMGYAASMGLVTALVSMLIAVVVFRTLRTERQ